MAGSFITPISIHLAQWAKQYQRRDDLISSITVPQSYELVEYIATDDLRFTNIYSEPVINGEPAPRIPQPDA